MSTITMYDAIPEEFANIPADPPAVASYVDGFGGYSQLAARFPHAQHVPITIHGNHARVADTEAGAMSIGQLPGWYHNQADHSQGKPWVYGSASNIAAMIAEMTHAGISRSSYFVWSAHTGRGRHICSPGVCGFPQADGTQWSFTVNGRSCDVSELSASMLTEPVPPRPHGLAKMELTYDLGKFHWHIQRAGGNETLGPDDRWAAAEVEFNVRTGHCRVKRVHWNNPPLGG